MDSVFVTLAKGAPAGMLLAYHPHNGSTHALMTGLWFANGVVLSPDESYVLVTDSLQARIHRWVTLWCAGSWVLQAPCCVRAVACKVYTAHVIGEVCGLGSHSGAVAVYAHEAVHCWAYAAALSLL
jgi:hypothetical protein